MGDKLVPFLEGIFFPFALNDITAMNVKEKMLIILLLGYVLPPNEQFRSRQSVQIQEQSLRQTTST